MKVFLIVLDSVGIGAAPDAAAYGDAGAATLPHCAEAVGGLHLPALQAMGIGNVPGILSGGHTIRGVPAAPHPTASWGALQELSQGKDTTTGHWEMAGLLIQEGFHIFPPAPPSFPGELVAAFARRTGRDIIGNKAASGTAIIEELGTEHMETGKWIAYTSADSVLQIAAHEDVIPLEQLYAGCRIARELCDPLRVGRVIARPFVGSGPGNFTRTQNRRDFSLLPPEPTILDHLQKHGVKTVTVGKLDDIFAGKGIDRAEHVENNAAAQRIVLDIVEEPESQFVFVNLIDFDTLYGHRRDAAGYAAALEHTDLFLADLLPLLNDDDCLMITADHGNDPTFKGTDHTREFVPFLVYRPGQRVHELGIRQGFYDVAQSVADLFGTAPMPRGVSVFG
ncbi:MAG: phosphopentomutase [Kiritimatiellia bacterium]|jgi:phosphopentomutase|nr:phosphopentomutase [Candidatus Brocadiia bacterium]MDP6630877.1 phosphopentomutase [Kiritimatiellia bacterium]MDP6811145.1 phosphopentomutase [Kiritimatiellia bacterium]MDP7023418.1 phosphopentomutase [Kiritimatiellia bacterium]